MVNTGVSSSLSPIERNALQCLYCYRHPHLLILNKFHQVFERSVSVIYYVAVKTHWPQWPSVRQSMYRIHYPISLTTLQAPLLILNLLRIFSFLIRGTQTWLSITVIYKTNIERLGSTNISI